MKKILLCLILISVIFVAISYAIREKRIISWYSSEYSSPSKTWSAFLEAIRNKKYDLVLRCILPDSNAYREYTKDKINNFNSMCLNSNFKITREEDMGDYYILSVKAILYPSKREHSILLPFVKRNSRYYIVDEEYAIKNSKYWESYETENMMFYYEKKRFCLEEYNVLSEDERINFEFLGNKKETFSVLERDYKTASKYLSVTHGKKISYYIVTSKTSFQLLTDYNEYGEYPAGVAYPDKNKIVTFFSYNPHEIIHILNSKIGNPPLLFNELFTDYVESIITCKYNDAVIRAKENVKKSDKYIALSHIFNNLSSIKKNDTLVESELFTFIDYLITKYSIENYKKLYSEINSGNYEEIIYKVYGMSLMDLEEEWKDIYFSENLSSVHKSVMPPISQGVFKLEQALLF